MVRDFVPVLGEGMPVGGESWEEWIDSALRQTYSPERFVQMTESRHDTATGVALTDKFTERLELRHWIRLPFLEPREIIFVLRKYRDGWNIPRIAALQRVHKSVVYEDRRSAFEKLIRLSSANPLFVLEPRERMTNTA